MSKRVGLDTNILARYYVAAGEGDAATLRQCELARKLIESDRQLAVSKTVLLEFEWVLRGYYKFLNEEIGQVFAHVLAMPNIEIENRDQVEKALDNYTVGLDFADALHHASYGHCSSMASFDDRGFAKKSKKLNLIPVVSLPR